MGDTREGDSDWITALEAVRRVAQLAGSKAAAQDILAQRLWAGTLRARADKLMLVVEKIAPGSLLRLMPPVVPCEEKAVEVAVTLWRRSEDWADDVAKWVWAVGDFLVTLPYDGSGKLREFRVLGVKFDADEIAALALGTPKGEGGEVSEGVSAPSIQATKRPNHRPSKSPTVLKIFARRLRAGAVQQSKSEEARRISKQWKNSDPPAPKSIVGWIGSFHEQCRWDQGRLINGEQVAEVVEKVGKVS